MRGGPRSRSPAEGSAPSREPELGAKSGAISRPLVQYAG